MAVRQGQRIQRLDIYVEGWCNLSDVVAVLENQSLSVAGVRMGTRMIVVKSLHSGLLVWCQVEI